ncbi:Nucleotide-binding alpha-beta plait domain [Phytophthora cactorum]|nr:Nucleotide-binding alpha-beta plait domain [Phytophthora cactorum]
MSANVKVSNRLETMDSKDEGNDARQEEEVKVIVMNYGKAERVAASKGVSFLKVQKARQLSFGFVHFRSKEERAEAFPKLQGIEWNGETLEVKDALPKKSMKPMRKRNKREPDEKQQEGSKRTTGGRLAA